MSSSIFRHGIRLPIARGLPSAVFSKSVSWQAGRHHVEIRIPVPWGHLAGKWWGPQDKRPILCLHGMQESCGSFDPLMQHLSRELAFLAIDLPGHGHSTWMPKGTFYHETNAPMLMRRIQKYFDWPQLSFLAHSFGAYPSFYFAALFPRDVDLIIELDGAKPFSGTAGSAIEETGKKIDRLLRYEQLSDSQAPGYTYDEIRHKLLDSDMYNGSLASHNVKYVLDRIIRKAPLDPTKYNFVTDSRAKVVMFGMQHDDICEYAKRITCPVLKIKATKSHHFESDKYVEDVLEIMKTNNKDFEFVLVEGTHHSHVNEPDKIAEIVTKFLAKHDKC